MTEHEIFDIILEHLKRISAQKQKPVRVAINGIEGTGKTVFANKLTAFIKGTGKNARQVSIDGFHFNKEYRYRQGRDSAKGYYEDSYDEKQFVEKVLLSSQNQVPKITPAIHDLESDEYLTLEPEDVPNDIILITDGAYLFKPNYRKHWDMKIYLKTSNQTALGRGIKRDAQLLGGLEAAAEKYKKRYHKASGLYIAENNPELLADMIIDNTDFENLQIIKTPSN